MSESTPAAGSGGRAFGSRRSRHALLALGAVAAFLGIASVIKPPPRAASAAGEGVGVVRRAPGGAQAPAAPAHPKGWKLIGVLRGREHEVRAYASPDGPRYGVHALDGRLLQADLPADEVYRAFPGIDLENLRDDPPEASGALMLAPVE